MLMVTDSTHATIADKDQPVIHPRNLIMDYTVGHPRVSRYNFENFSKTEQKIDTPINRKH
jgi:hypothetical protein